MPQIAVVGSLHYDLLIRQQRLPARGETLTGAEAFAAPGGKGANQAVQCAKLGKATVLLGVAGRDALGDTLVASLAGYGVDPALVLRRPGTTGLGVVQCLPDGSVYASVASGVNQTLSPADVSAAAPALRACRALLTQNETPEATTLAALRLAREAGLYAVYNAAPARRMPPEAFALCDCLMLNEVEASFTLGTDVRSPEDALRLSGRIRVLGAACCVVTLGEGGSVLVNAREAAWIPAEANVTVRETTGAGDSYAGAFAAAKLDGASDREACAFATRAAAFTVGGIGAQPAMPTLSDLSTPPADKREACE